MTRINLIHTRAMTTPHLLAEYRELPRVFGLIDKWIERGCPLDGIPLNYTMGKGHVKFFYRRATFLAMRFDLIVEELGKRGIRPQYTTQWHRVKAIEGRGQIQNLWAPTHGDIFISQARITERLANPRRKA